MGRTVYVYRLKREKREGESLELYVREKCAISPASGQLVLALYIHATNSVLTY
jgi:hypothetical protein